MCRIRELLVHLLVLSKECSAEDRAPGSCWSTSPTYFIIYCNYKTFVLSGCGRTATPAHEFKLLFLLNQRHKLLFNETKLSKRKFTQQDFEVAGLPLTDSCLCFQRIVNNKLTIQSSITLFITLLIPLNLKKKYKNDEI